MPRGACYAPRVSKASHREMFTIAEAFYCDCRLVRECIEDTAWPIALRECKATPSDEKTTYRLILERVLAWLHSLDRLNRPTDLQAVAAGRARSSKSPST